MYIDQLKGWQPELEAQKADVEEQLGAQAPASDCLDLNSGSVPF